jgi:hypothetical protein
MPLMQLDFYDTKAGNAIKRRLRRITFIVPLLWRQKKREAIKNPYFITHT